MTQTSSQTAQTRLSPLTTPIKENAFGPIVVHETVARVPYKLVAKWLLQGRVVSRHTDQTVRTGRCSLGFDLWSVIFQIKNRNLLYPIDAIDALRIQSYLHRYKAGHQGKPVFEERADNALSFCKGVLGFLEHEDPESFRQTVESLYPYRAKPLGTLHVVKSRGAWLSLDAR